MELDESVTLCKSLIVSSSVATKAALSSNAIREMRKILVRSPTGSSKKKILYVSRRDAETRRVANEEEIIGELQDLGVTCVVPGRMSFLEQVEAFADAEVVVGPHGAGLANIIFSRDAEVVELSQRRWHPALWYVSDACGFDHSVVMADGEVQHRQSFNPGWTTGAYPTSLFVDPKLVRRAVEAALERRGAAQ